MPKAKPDQVVVHRIELQEKEREMLQAIAGAQVAKNIAVPAALSVGVGVAGYVGYKAAKSLAGWTEDIFDDLGEIVNDKIMEPILGKPTYTDERTGKTYKNPLAGFPVLGSLFGSGINLGIASVNHAKSNSEKQAERRANDPRSQQGGHPAYDNYGKPKTYDSREEMYGV
jgi:hypothetical protein